MADKAEKDLDQVSDCSWVRGLDANGNPIRILKSDLLGAMFQENGNVDQNLNNYTETGMYGLNSDLYDCGLDQVSYGMLIVFSGKLLALGGSPVVQIAIGTDSNPFIWIRTAWLDCWTGWKKISFT